MVADILGCAVAVERVFSGGRDTISIRRNSLNPSTISMLMTLKAALQLAQKSPSQSISWLPALLEVLVVEVDDD